MYHAYYRDRSDAAHKAHGVEFLHPELLCGYIFCDIVLTNKRVLVDTDATNGIVDIPLSDFPALIDHDTRVMLPSEAWGKNAFLKHICYLVLNPIYFREFKLVLREKSSIPLLGWLSESGHIEGPMSVRRLAKRMAVTIARLKGNDGCPTVPTPEGRTPECATTSHALIPTWQLIHVGSSLQDGEIPVFATRKHWSALLPWLIACVPTAFIAFLFGVDPTVIIGLCLVACVVRYFSSEYVVTDRRVLIREGILNRNMKDEELLSIKKIGVSMTWMDTFLGRGSVTLAGTGGDSETLDRLADPEAFRDAIQKMQNHRRSAE